MKYTLEEIFGNLESNELDELIPNDFDSKLPPRALKRIEKEALRGAGIKTERRFNFKILAPVAACLALTVGIGGFAIAGFFAKNGLSAEMLNHLDLKTVYRDITTHRTANDKTAEVIKRSVPGVEILQKEAAPEDSSAFWDGSINTQHSSRPGDVEYRQDYEYQPETEYYEWDKIIVECLRNGETLWKTEFPSLGKNWGDDEFYVETDVMTSAGTALWGQRTHWTVVDDSKSNNLDYGWLARIDNSGNKLWQKELNHGFNYEHIRAVLDNGDGTWAVFSSGDFKYLCLTQFDINGNELSFQKTKVDEMNIMDPIQKAVRLGDGYLVCVGGASIMKLDHSGNVTDSFVYESDDCDYYITDMVEYEGKVYLSAYAVPKQTDEGGRHEIANILDYVFSKNDWKTSPGEMTVNSDELIDIVRNNYTAVLLLCDPDSGEPNTFYSVKGALGGALAVEDNQLKWNAESIVGAFYSPYTSSFSIGGRCKVYQYSFNKNGALADCEDTGETTGFNR